MTAYRLELLVRHGEWVRYSELASLAVLTALAHREPLGGRIVDVRTGALRFQWAAGKRVA